MQHTNNSSVANFISLKCSSAIRCSRVFLTATTNAKLAWMCLVKNRVFIFPGVYRQRHLSNLHVAVI